jgi:hypothetical protein
MWLAPPVMACNIDCHCARGIGTMRKNTPYGGWGRYERFYRKYESRKFRYSKRAVIEAELAAEEGEHEQPALPAAADQPPPPLQRQTRRTVVRVAPLALVVVGRPAA